MGWLRVVGGKWVAEYFVSNTGSKVLSEKDAQAQVFSEFDSPFVYEGDQ